MTKTGKSKRDTIAHIVLASNSPRRKWLLENLGLEFISIPAGINEAQLPNEHPGEYTLRVSEQKAMWVGQRLDNPALVIAADTTVADGDTILGKPSNMQDAEQMLLRLRGRTHQVYTGICVLSAVDKKKKSDLCVTKVTMRNYTFDELNSYINSGDAFDKAGAYAIQHDEFHPVEEIQGCYANVVGLPMCHLVRALKSFGIHIEKDIPRICEETFHYHCTISNDIFVFDDL